MSAWINYFRPSDFINIHHMDATWRNQPDTMWLIYVDMSFNQSGQVDIRLLNSSPELWIMWWSKCVRKHQPHRPHRPQVDKPSSPPTSWTSCPQQLLHQWGFVHGFVCHIRSCPGVQQHPHSTLRCKASDAFPKRAGEAAKDVKQLG